jgi:hypothetical protein
MRRFLLCLLVLAAPLLAAPSNPFQLARQAADVHFNAVNASDRKGWGQTFAQSHGDLAGLWLQAQQEVRSGHKFTFGKSVSIKDTTIKLIYTKRDAKGKPVDGAPVTLVLEGGRWVVTEVSY